ncbi:excalibur calcium-binding domain-containing protein [Streptomyces cyaneofuscatus]
MCAPPALAARPARRGPAAPPPPPPPPHPGYASHLDRDGDGVGCE